VTPDQGRGGKYKVFDHLGWETLVNEMDGGVSDMRSRERGVQKSREFEKGGTRDLYPDKDMGAELGS